jgi:hypothetical protein
MTRLFNGVKKKVKGVRLALLWLLGEGVREGRGNALRIPWGWMASLDE